MEKVTSTRQQESVESFLDEHGEELEQVISDEEPEEDVTGQGASMDKNSNLHFSAARGMIETSKDDLESPDQTIDAENFMGWTPLMMAVRNGHIETVKFLLEKGADVTKKNKLGVNIFNISISNGNLELMEIVLRHMLKGGISRNRIQENLSPISLAIIFKRTHLLRFLMSQGFDLNATTWKTGLTPLMFAAAVSAEKIIPVLEVKGANNKARNYMGVNHQEILQWRRHGIENMRGPVKVTKPKLTLPTISVRKPNETTPETPTVEIVTTIPIVKKMASPISLENNGKVHSKVGKAAELLGCIEAKVFIPQEIGVVPKPNAIEDEENNFNDENDQNQINRIEKQHLPPPNDAGPYMVGPGKPKKEKRFVQPLPRNDSSIISYPYQQSPYNGLPCPLYIPVLNSPYGAPVPSPVTPMMIQSPFQNFMASVGDLAQNSPMMQPSQSNYQCGPPGQPIFFQGAMPRPDMNYAYDSNTLSPIPNGYQGTPFFYTVYPTLPNVYSLPGST